MKKVVCPKCGGQLILENLCQYGERQQVCKNGKLRKKVTRVDHGSMEFQYLFCNYCKYCFEENDLTQRVSESHADKYKVRNMYIAKGAKNEQPNQDEK